MSTTDVKVIWVPQRSAPTSAEAFTGPKWRKIWSNGHPNVRGASSKSHPEGKAPMMPIMTHAPLEVVALDFLTLSRPTDTYQYVLVATDLFTKYAWAIPTRDQTASTTAKAILKHIIQTVGCPERFHSDQGANFESALLKELCQYYGCRKSRTTPYHPEGNGTCERWNQTLLNMLGTLEVEQRSRWAQHLPELVQAYNNSIHTSTGYTPHFLMYGWNARLPVEVTSGVWKPTSMVTTEEWVQLHHQRLALAYEKVRDNLDKASSRDKQCCDQKAKTLPLLPGERVLVHTNRRYNQGKLADRWEPDVHVVVGQPSAPGGPTYQV